MSARRPSPLQCPARFVATLRTPMLDGMALGRQVGKSESTEAIRRGVQIHQLLDRLFAWAETGRTPSGAKPAEIDADYADLELRLSLALEEGSVPRSIQTVPSADIITILRGVR